MSRFTSFKLIISICIQYKLIYTLKLIKFASDGFGHKGSRILDLGVQLGDRMDRASRHIPLHHFSRHFFLFADRQNWNETMPLTAPACAPHPSDVFRRITGKVEKNDVFHVNTIDPSRGSIGTEQYVDSFLVPLRSLQKFLEIWLAHLKF